MKALKAVLAWEPIAGLGPWPLWLSDCVVGCCIFVGGCGLLVFLMLAAPVPSQKAGAGSVTHERLSTAIERAR